ncbi:hypothetical protein HIM_09832 [Hirsutella minnesotensis 3608]|uniref:Myb-like domain-containing protein n=1 Tax=Hirsutella minnesotensis 3608 TaxID=1043627 RepID=A0A0F7ZXI5_9HYPO|nr:hypothetical protein HIM_09832 [Hirsutella minnesotensis 3608]
MSAPLKFKPYVPAPQRQRKKNRLAHASYGHRRDVTLPEAGGEAQSLQSWSAGFMNMQGREDMATLNLDSLDWPDETQSFSRPMQRCYASKADGKEIDENPGISSNCISFLAPVDSESIQGDAQNQGILKRLDDDVQARDESAILIGDSVCPAGVSDHNMDAVDDGAIQTVPTRAETGVSMQSPDLLQPSTDQRRSRLDSTISSSAPTASAPSLASAESPFLDSLLDDDACFQRWLDGGQQQSGAPISKRTKQVLHDSQVGNGTDDQRDRKGQSLLSSAEHGMYQPSICDVASTVAHDPVDAHDRCRRLLPVRRMNSNYSNSCDDDRPAAKALTHDPTQCSHLAMTDRGDPNGPTVGIRSDAAAFSAESSKQHVSHPSYYTMAAQPRTSGTMWSPLVELPPAVPFGEAQDMEQTGQCKSCVIFRAALFESLSLLHRPLTGGVSRKARRDQRETKILKHHHNLRRRSMVPNSSYEDNSDTESPSCTDQDRLQVIEDSNRGDDDASDSLSVKLGTRGRLAKRRRWSALEERRLTAWKRESKSESWIASKLNRTESAVKQQWRKMSHK